MNTPSLLMVTVMSEPSSVVNVSPSERLPDMAVAPTTWYFSISASCPVGSASSASIVSCPSAAKASSVGAKSVNGPSPESAPARSAAITAASSVSWRGLLTTISTIEVGCVMTASITCTTPLSASMSVTVIMAWLMYAIWSNRDTNASVPSSISTIWPSERSPAITLPLATWYWRMEVRFPEGSASSASIVSWPSAANASSVGANTVKGPVPDKAVSNPAANTAASRVLWSSLPTIMSTTVLVCAFTETTANNAMNSESVKMRTRSVVSTKLRGKLFVFITYFV